MRLVVVHDDEDQKTREKRDRIRLIDRKEASDGKVMSERTGTGNRLRERMNERARDWKIHEANEIDKRTLELKQRAKP